MTCLWPMPTNEDGIPPDWESLPEPVKAVARELACRSLERLTGYRVGTCPVTVVLVPSGNSAGFDLRYTYLLAEPSMFAFNWVGEGFNSWCGENPGDCSVVLPGPVGRVDEVLSGGVPVTEYRIEDGNRLVYTGTGDCPFVSLADVQVTYVNAHLPGPAGLQVMAILAQEFGLAIVDDDGCRLPPNTQSVTRQGVSVTMVAGTFPEGRTGIHEIDAWLGLWNPKGLSDAPQVWSPDLPQYRRIGG